MGQLMTVPTVRVSGSRGLNGIVLMPPSPSGVRQDDARQKYGFTIKRSLKSQLRFHNFIIPRDGFRVRARLRGRADCTFTPSGLAKIFGDDAGVASRHWLIYGDRLYQRAIRSEEFVPIVAVGDVEQFAQCPCRKLRLVHARTVLRHG
jgi:hypothetical protein